VKPIKDFHDSYHAQIKRNERDVPSIQAMKDVVNYHDRKTQQYRGRHGGFVYKFFKKVDNQEIVVVAEIKKHECWLMTVWKTM
jgi:hypothetical protein